MKKTTLSFLMACSFAASAASTAAQAVGNRIDVQIVDRKTGETLTPVLYRGEWWVAGRPGARYGVYLRNRSGVRTENVLSVDGVNAVTGEDADWRQTGYLLGPNASWRIDGWRKNENEVAAFEFTNLPDAYAARTGRPGNVGVIGVAVFDERVRVAPVAPVMPTEPLAKPSDRSAPPPPMPEAAAPGRSTRSTSDAAADAASSVPPAAPTMQQTEKSLASTSRERLGTGHGAIETSVVTYVDFVRAKPVPAEIVILHYDRRENLVARGILPPTTTTLPPIAANPFPDNHRFVADPPPRP